MNPALLAMLAQSGVVTNLARPGLYKLALEAAKNKRTPIWALQAIQKWKDADTRMFGSPQQAVLDPRNPNLRAEVQQYLEQDPALARFRARHVAP